MVIQMSKAIKVDISKYKTVTIQPPKLSIDEVILPHGHCETCNKIIESNRVKCEKCFNDNMEQIQQDIKD